MIVLLLLQNLGVIDWITSRKHEVVLARNMSEYLDKKDYLDRNSPNLIFFDGGSDVTPSYYGELNLSSACNPERDAYESEIFKIYKNTDTKFAGICRGSQFLNVMHGGSLWQDLPMHHTYYHEVINLGFSIFQEIFKVNSTHHQGVKVLAPSLIPLLIEPKSGIIEGYKSADDRTRAVQSHPEFRDQIYKNSYSIMEWLFEERV